MATSLFFGLVLLALSFSSVIAEPKVVHMPISRQSGDAKLEVARRAPGQKHAEVLIGNAVETALYYVNASVGTPPQHIQLQIDTGSSDVWMFGINSCDTSTSPCLGYAFDPSKSSSLTLYNRAGFSIRYVTPGSGVIGDYIGDIFGIGDTTIHNLTMAVATKAEYVPTGIMGIGFSSDESIISNGGKTYPNVVDDMVSQGLINTHAYSLWLNDLQSQDGSILFGGYDTGKFTGQLTALEIQPDAQTGSVTSMTVAWTSLTINDSKNGKLTLTSNNLALPALLDSGTSLTYIPEGLFSQVADYVRLVPDSDFDPGLVDCEVFDTYKMTFDFGFGGDRGPIISVPLSELAIPVQYDDGTQVTFSDGRAACTFGIGPATDDSPLLFGDTFLRSAYVVYDLDSKLIALAKPVYNSDATNIVEIGNGSAAPSWNIVSGVSVTQTATGIYQEPSFSDSAVMSHITIAATASTTNTFQLPLGTGETTASTSSSLSGAAALSLVMPETILTVAISVISAVLGVALIAFR